MKILKIFPRKTNSTPEGEDVIINRGPQFFDEADEIHISVCFTWDLPVAESLYNNWKFVAPTKIGGPAFMDPEGEFIPGMYLKKGITITSRGCPGRCWFCRVWRKNPEIKELPIRPGHIVQDDNLLSCSRKHIEKVFEMLKDQGRPIIFTGGIEAKLLNDDNINLLSLIKIKRLFCSYDTPGDLGPLIEAGKRLREIDINYKNRRARCYVLIGYPGDTIPRAEERIKQTVRAGFFPFAMLYRDDQGNTNKTWRQFQRLYSNSFITDYNCQKLLNKI